MTNFSHSTLAVNYRTPRRLWEPLHEICKFTWDLMASDENHLFTNYFTEKRSLITHYREAAGASCFANPAWGRGFKPGMHQITRVFLELARDHGALVVALLPAAFGNRWMHDHVIGWAEIIQPRGRPTFDAPDGNGPVRVLNKKTGNMDVSPANFDICFAVWEPGCTYKPEGRTIRTWDPYLRAKKNGE